MNVMEEKTENLMDGLMNELNRNRELLALYKSIPTGAFGAAIINATIIRGEAAIKSGDVIQMLQAYSELKYNQ